ncbi:DUF5683 domain-containing protein [Hymenobacter sp. BT635]|uniref:DUF5683 domain-containing protein n=1 Tax=Hymenobacter nitidus TaxID=2880929 RepID=A0ABS8AD02_9BACT|nr:DUF5683 domain-containing protein [Hymenobacter nitidus]MCB2378273.1 DUF5683 domain-containing protein [Hymenobacter nitidus]
MLNRNRLAALGLLAMLPLAGPVCAQIVTAGPDSAVVGSPVITKESRRTEKLFGVSMTRPKKAGILSAILPGAGQIYNRKYWKLPLVYGAVGGTIYGELYYQRLYKEFKLADAYQKDGDPNTSKDDAGPNAARLDSSNIYRALTTYRTPRDQFYFYIGIAYALNILDAVVDAHLKDFDISDDLSLQWQPTMLWMPSAPLTPGLSLTLTLTNTRPKRPTE